MKTTKGAQYHNFINTTPMPRRQMDTVAERLADQARRFRWFMLLALMVFMMAQAAAQATRGSLTGLVKDPNDLPVAGASITIKNLRTNEQLTMQTNESGVFVAPSLAPGQYAVTVEMPGFKKVAVEPVIVETARPAHVDVKLDVSPIAEQIVVTATAAQADINVTTPEINTILTRRQLLNLPMIRNPFLIVNTLPGINAPSASGTRGTSTNITQDGINVADHFNRFAFGVNTTVITENTAEVSISTNTVGADGGFGMTQIRVVTPSGTNELHGSVYWYHQNNALNANSFFNNSRGIPRSPGHVNSLGFEVGGPVYVPKLYNGKNRTFFFASVDYRRQPATSIVNSMVLTESARRGLFSYVGTDGVQREVNLLQIGNFSALNPTTMQLINKTPLPNNSDVGDGFNIGGYRFGIGSDTNTDRHTIRLDHVLTSKHELEATYTHNSVFSGPFSVAFPGLPAADQFARRQSAVFALHSSLSPSLSNTARFGFKIEPFSRRFGRAETFPFRIDFQQITDPESLSSGFLQDTPSKEFNDQFYWTRGAHSFSFGFESRWIAGRNISETGIIPQVTLGASGVNPSGIDATELPGSSAAIRTRAEGIYANLVGLVNSASQTVNVTSLDSGFVPGAPFERRLAQNFVAWFAQDRWRVTPYFTATLGLRWEYHGVPQFTRGAALLPVGGSDGLWGVSGLENLFAPGRLNGQPTTLDFGAVEGTPPLYEKDWNNFAPSIGFAWDVTRDGRTSVRGGYSISYTPEALTLYLNVANQNRGLQATSTNSTYTGVLTSSGVPLPVPQFQVPISQASLFTLSNTANVAAFNPNYRTPYIQQWSIGIERALPAEFVVEARYVGNHGVKLTRGVDLNEVNIFENGFLADFLRAANNLAINRANNVISFANLGQPGQVPLPLLDAIFGGTNTAFHRNSTFISLLDSGQAGIFANNIRLTPRTYPGLRNLPPNFFVVNPDANSAFFIDNGSYSHYHAFQLEARRRFSVGFFLTANYTFSKILTDFSGSTTEISPLTTFRNPRIDLQRPSYDIAHVFNLTGVYELPFGPGRRFLADSPGVIQRLVEGWNTSTIVRITSGSAVSFISGQGTFNQRTTSTTIALGPNLSFDQLQGYLGIFKTPGGVLAIDPNAPFMRLTYDAAGRISSATVDPTQLQNPAPGQLGQLPLGAFRSPLTWNADIALFKRTTVWENVNVEFRAELFNAFNHPTFSFPGSLNITGTQFGVITSAGSRFIQMSARVNF